MEDTSSNATVACELEAQNLYILVPSRKAWKKAGLEFYAEVSKGYCVFSGRLFFLSQSA